MFSRPVHSHCCSRVQCIVRLVRTPREYVCHASTRFDSSMMSPKMCSHIHIYISIYVWWRRGYNSVAAASTRTPLWINTVKSLVKAVLNTKTKMFLVSSSSCLCAVYWRQLLSRKRRCSWSSADKSMLQIHLSYHQHLYRLLRCVLYWMFYGKPIVGFKSHPIWHRFALLTANGSRSKDTIFHTTM